MLNATMNSNSYCSGLLSTTLIEVLFWQNSYSSFIDKFCITLLGKRGCGKLCDVKEISSNLSSRI